MWIKFHPRYEVSITGQIRNENKYILKPSISSPGYPQVEIDGKSTNIHRIVADMFCPRIHIEKLQVDHIDRNRANNHASNLRWVTCSENHKNRTPRITARADNKSTKLNCIYYKPDGNRQKRYWLKIDRHNLKHSTWYETLEEAIAVRDILLKNSIV